MRLAVIRSLFAVEPLARLIDAEYGLGSVHCQLIKGTIRDIYRVASDAGPFVLAIYRSDARTTEEIVGELDFIAHLHSGGVPVACAVPRLNGDRLMPILAPEGLRQAVLFNFVHGAHLDKLPNPTIARRVGQTVARVHAVADTLSWGLDRPDIHDPKMLDEPIAAFAAVAPHHPHTIAILLAAAEAIRPVLAALPREGPAYGLIHGDVIPSNVIVADDGSVVLLDFDFCGYGWRAYDVATYLLEVEYWGAPDDARESFLEGYLGVRALTAAERTALPALEVGRAIASLGIPAMNLNVWGSAYLSNAMIETTVAIIERRLTAWQAPGLR